MINKTRVKRIKNVIYTFIVLLFLAPAVILLAVSVRMLRRISDLENTIAQVYPYSAHAAPPYASGASANNQPPPESYGQYYDSNSGAYGDEPLEVSEPLVIPEIPNAGKAGQQTAAEDPDQQADTENTGQQADLEDSELDVWTSYGDIESPNTGIPDVELPDTGVPQKGWW